MTYSHRTLITAGICLVLVTAAIAGAALDFSNQYPVTHGTTYSAGDSGPSVTLGFDTNISSGNPFPDNNTFELESAHGNATFTSTANTSVKIDDVTGTWTRVSQMDVTNGELTIDPEDKQAIRVQGDTDHLSFTSVELDDGNTDVSYGGPDGGTTTLTVTDVPADTAIVAVNATGATLDKSVSTSGGEVTFNLPQSDHDIQLQSSSTNTPEITNPDPTGPQSTTPSELAVDVTDDDFESDEVQVNITLDGAQIHSENITSDSRVAASVGDLEPGEHTWTVTAADEYGNTEQQTYTFRLPDELRIYNESAPETLIDDREVGVTVYSDGDEVFTRNTTTGNISLDGLPTTTDLVVVAQADGYITRSAVIEDTTVQNRMYLLNENTSSVDVRFLIDDPTGVYPPESTQLFIKRPLTVNGSTTFQTVAADEFGVEGFTTALEQDTRYRLVIKNQKGDRQVLGSYTAVASETVTLQPSGIEVDYSDGETYAWSAGYVNDTDTHKITFVYSDPARETTDLEVTIYERNNESNTLSGYPTTYTGTLGNVSITEQLTDEQSDKEWVVEWSADRHGEEISSQKIVGEHTVQLPSLDPWWQQAIGFAIVLMTGGLFSRANVGVGAVTVALVAGMFYWWGWFAGPTSGAAVVIGLGVAVIVWATQPGGP